MGVTVTILLFSFTSARKYGSFFFQKKGKCRIMIVAKVRKRNEKTEQQQQQTSGRRI
jgi:hypothetical protein